jgi:hypothetical protein
MSSEGLKENMDKEGESIKARVTLGRRVRKTRFMDEMDWWTRGGGPPQVGCMRALGAGRIGIYTNTSRNLDRRLLTSQVKDYHRHLAMLNPGDKQASRMVSSTPKEATIFVENREDRGKFYSTYVNKKSCSGLAASGRRRSCPSSRGRCCPSPAGKNLPQHFPNYYFYNSGHIAIFTEYTAIDFF